MQVRGCGFDPWLRNYNPSHMRGTTKPVYHNCRACVCNWAAHVLQRARVLQLRPDVAKYRGQSEVAQSCPTLCDPMDCSLIRFLRPWDFPGKSAGVDCHVLLQGIFPTQESNPDLPRCRQTLYRLSHQGSPIIIIVWFNLKNAY